jgi:hypothetical protein
MGLNLADVLGVKDLVGKIVEEVGKHIPTPESELKKQELAQALEITILDKMTQVDLAQAQINLEETKKEGWFYSGWRPACGWVCVTAIAQNYALFPWIKILFPTVLLPNLAIESLMTLLLSLLGLGTQRTVEKIRDANKKR